MYFVPDARLETEDTETQSVSTHLVLKKRKQLEKWQQINKNKENMPVYPVCTMMLLGLMKTTIVAVTPTF